MAVHAWLVRTMCTGNRWNASFKPKIRLTATLSHALHLHPALLSLLQLMPRRATRSHGVLARALERSSQWLLGTAQQRRKGHWGRWGKLMGAGAAYYTRHKSANRQRCDPCRQRFSRCACQPPGACAAPVDFSDPSGAGGLGAPVGRRRRGVGERRVVRCGGNVCCGSGGRGTP